MIECNHLGKRVIFYERLNDPAIVLKWRVEITEGRLLDAQSDSDGNMLSLLPNYYQKSEHYTERTRFLT